MTAVLRGRRPRVAGRTAQAAAPAVIGTVVLMVVTWKLHGYAYGRWPQPGFLVNVVHYDGQLQGDWFAALPPVHWAFAHALGALPGTAVEPAVLGGWILYLVLLWGAILSVGRSLRLPWTAAIGAGLVLAATDLDGVGLSNLLLGYLYPTGLSFAFAMAGLALLLRDRVLAAGVAVGLATLIHPGLGALMIAVIAPAVLVGRRDRTSALLRFAIPCLALGGISVAQAALAQAKGSTLSAHARFELVAIVRAPHHFLYSAFPLAEYLATLSWLALTAAGAVLLRASREVRILTAVAGCALGLCIAGGLASLAETPLTLVQLQTARISPMLVVLGALLGAAMLVRLLGRYAGAVLVAIAAIVPTAADHLVPTLVADALGPSATGVVTISLLEAIAMMGTLALSRLGRSTWRRWPSSRLGLNPAAVTIVASILLIAGTLHVASQRSFGASPDQQAFADVAAKARTATHSRQLVLGPPDMDGLSYLSRRPVVVSFGTFAFGSADREWIRRMQDVTGDPRVLDPRLGADAAMRVQMIARAYDRRIRTSTEPICRYRAAVVITRSSAGTPRWLKPIYHNAVYTLSRPQVRCP